MVTSESIAESGSGSIVESGAGSFIGSGAGSFVESSGESDDEDDFEELSADEVLRQLDMASLGNLENEADEVNDSGDSRGSGRVISDQIPILERMSEHEADVAAAESLMVNTHADVAEDEHVNDEAGDSDSDSDSDTFGGQHEIQGTINPIVSEDAFEDAIESEDVHHTTPERISDINAVHMTETIQSVAVEDAYKDAIESDDTLEHSPHAIPNAHAASSVVTMNPIVPEDEYANVVGSEETLHNSPPISSNHLVEPIDDDDWDEPHEDQPIEMDRLSTMLDEEEPKTNTISTLPNQQESEVQRESATATSMIDNAESLEVDRLSQEPHVTSFPDQEDELPQISAAVDRLTSITKEPHVISDQEHEILGISELSRGTIEDYQHSMPEVHQEVQFSPVNTPSLRQHVQSSQDLEQKEVIRLPEENNVREGFVSDQDLRESASTETITAGDDDTIEEKLVIVAMEEQSKEEQYGNTMEVKADEPPSTEADDEVCIPASIVLDDSVSVLPPPAPISRPVVYGTLNPTNENDESDDSDDDNDPSEGVPPPLNLPVSDDEEEELEVYQSVADTIRLESETRKSKSDGLKRVEDPNLIKAMASAVVQNTGNDEIVLAFETETRSPHTVGFDSPPVPAHTKEPADSDVFGIGYQNIKPRRQSTYGKQPSMASEYSLPKSSTFPDEKEFENDCELTTDVQFSVKNGRLSESPTATVSMGKHDGDDDDDEFGVTIAAVSIVDISADLLAAKRASFEARIASEQDALVQELKIETEQEHQHIVMGIQEGQTETVKPCLQKDDFEQALSVKELHNMYKRGLGDQSVLMMDDEPKEETLASPEGTPSEADASRLSVMGRILSKKSVMSQAITEEDDEDEADDDESQGEDENELVDEDQESTRADREMLIDYTENQNERESSASVDEWQEIELLQQAKKRIGAGANTTESGPDAPTADDSFMISYPEVAEYFSTAEEFLLQLDRIVVEDEGSPTKTSCFTCFARPRLAFSGANEERDRVFCIAATAYDPGNVVFVRTLQTIHSRFTSSTREVPLSGSHWESIGFQGNDPATDLRGCGVLSLLQMLYLVENHTELARRFFRLAQHPLRHFPLACTLINVTLQCIMALRSGALFRECNKQNSVINAINLFYVSLSSQLMDEIQSSTAEVPIVMKKVFDNGRLNPDKVIELGFQPSPSVPSSSSPLKARSTKGAATASESNVEFTEIALHSTGD